MHIKLTADLQKHIEAWDFSVIRTISVDEILHDDASKGILHSWFDIVPGPPPVGIVPSDIGSNEMLYVQQLLEAYGERDNCSFKDYGSIKDHQTHGPHLHMQRERFFDADAFSRFYRDNTMTEEIVLLQRDMMHGIVDVHRANHKDSLTRVDAVMAQAANVQPAGTLSRYTRVPVKQGFCHHFANEGKLQWRKS